MKMTVTAALMSEHGMTLKTRVVLRAQKSFHTGCARRQDLSPEFLFSKSHKEEVIAGMKKVTPLRLAKNATSKASVLLPLCLNDKG